MTRGEDYGQGRIFIKRKSHPPVTGSEKYSSPPNPSSKALREFLDP
jgi:hypothetical protein